MVAMVVQELPVMTEMTEQTAQATRRKVRGERSWRP